jgi:beta-phosphoglucomutase-like phosphatase (HAD superfamily)
VNRAKVLLCDADGSLFPSEEPAFVASVVVTNDFMAAFGRDVRFEPEQLRLSTTGKNFRATIVDLAGQHGIPIEPALAQRLGIASPKPEGRALTEADLEAWVITERQAVSKYLGEVLTPDPEVIAAITALAERYRLCVVSSSALIRLDACFRATGLDQLFPAELRFSAEDSLPVPTSKPDPAVYLYAGQQLGVTGEQGIAIEDSQPGAQSAIAAGFETLGNVCFVPEAERPERVQILQQTGASAVLDSWPALADRLLSV